MKVFFLLEIWVLSIYKPFLFLWKKKKEIEAIFSFAFLQIFLKNNFFCKTKLTLVISLNWTAPTLAVKLFEELFFGNGIVIVTSSGTFPDILLMTVTLTLNCPFTNEIRGDIDNGSCNCPFTLFQKNILFYFFREHIFLFLYIYIFLYIGTYMSLV